MSTPAIIPLFKQYREGALPAADLISQMDQVIDFCERQLTRLERLTVAEKDKDQWQNKLYPALEYSFKGLIGAAMLCKEYTTQPEPEIAEGIVFAFVQIDKLTAFIEQEVGQTSQDTQAQIQEFTDFIPPADQAELGRLQTGAAQAEVSLFEE